MVITENRVLPTPEGLVGPDFSYFMPYLLAGARWVHFNGWSTVPYFTPDFCGGMPWLANPQSIFYSFPQLLGVITDFVTAIKLTAVIFSAIGALATYAILRQCFHTSWEAAALGAVLFQLNGFLIFRIAVGHLTYHVFGLLPVILLISIYFAKHQPKQYYWLLACRMVIIGLLFSIMVYGGAINYVIPTVLVVSVVILSQQIFTGWYWRPWISLTGGLIWSIPLSMLKLSGALVLVSDYPRTYLSRLLFNDPMTIISYLFRAFFAPETLPSVIVVNQSILPPY